MQIVRCFQSVSSKNVFLSSILATCQGRALATQRKPTDRGKIMKLMNVSKFGSKHFPVFSGSKPAAVF